jgi:hypothetical protein
MQVAILLGVASAAAFATQSSTQLTGSNVPLCYCHCEYETGVKHCTKMCSLPKYENRWWAISCHKKISMEGEPSSPASNQGSKKTNRTEQVRR